MVQDIINGITGAIDSIGEAVGSGINSFVSNIAGGLVDLIINLLALMINIVIIPIDFLVSTFFPNLSLQIQHFNEGLSLLATSPIGFIMYHIPPYTRGLLLVYVSFMISYYTIIWTYRRIIIIPRVIQKIKFL